MYQALRGRESLSREEKLAYSLLARGVRRFLLTNRKYVRIGGRFVENVEREVDEKKVAETRIGFRRAEQGIPLE
jgi:hypothetical protein